MKKIRTFFSERVLHRLFEIGLTIKAIDGVLECIGGLLLLFIGRVMLMSIVIELTQHELLEDPHDLIANALVKVVTTLPEGAKIFGAIYLLLHGGVKIGMAIALWKDKLWAYPVSISILTIFVIYQIYRFLHTHSFILGTFTLLDIIIILLVWHEWNYHHHRLKKY